MEANKLNLLQFTKNIVNELQLAQAILSKYGITSIGYSRFYTDKCIRVSNNFEWMKFYIEKDILHKHSDRYRNELEMIGERKSYMLLRSQDQGSKKITNLMNKYNIDNVCSLYIKHDDYIEMFGFSTDVGKPNISNFYINNEKILFQYTLFLKERLYPNLNSHLNQIYLPFSILLKNENTAYEQNLLSFTKNTSLKRIYLKDSLFITIQEYNCLYYLSIGNSYKEIANKLNLSSKTVETHINFAKHKLGHLCKSDLINILKQNSVIFN